MAWSSIGVNPAESRPASSTPVATSKDASAPVPTGTSAPVRASFHISARTQPASARPRSSTIVLRAERHPRLPGETPRAAQQEPRQPRHGAELNVEAAARYRASTARPAARGSPYRTPRGSMKSTLYVRTCHHLAQRRMPTQGPETPISNIRSSVTPPVRPLGVGLIEGALLSHALREGPYETRGRSSPTEQKHRVCPGILCGGFQS